MTTRIWLPVLAWLLAVVAALLLAGMRPHESLLLGRLHPVTAKRLDQRELRLPQELPAGRTLALVVFESGQRAEAQSWIEGLRLRHDAGIAWLKLPVYEDPGSPHERHRIQDAVARRHAGEHDGARLVTVFANKLAFARAAGLPDAAHASVLVLDRQGNVLARAHGHFDSDKAEALRETVLARND